MNKNLFDGIYAPLGLIVGILIAASGQLERGDIENIIFIGITWVTTRIFS
jgi:hypothetical protein